MKIFYILPHCSTGGMPQYALRQSQEFGKMVNVTVFEVNNVSNDFVVQRTQFKNLVQLNGNQVRLLDYIKKEKPNVLHFQEIPETFLTMDTIAAIYNDKRRYNIVVTTHSCMHGRKDFTYIPDKIIAVSNWQKTKLTFEFPDTEVDLWEYPIDIKKKKLSKEDARHLIIDNTLETWVNPDYTREQLHSREYNTHWPYKRYGKHILNVGLFTPGKNQGELFEIARENTDNIYHFVGNQADNFKDYWEPLMKNKPYNCIIWYERNDVDLFYQACDEMYFTSKWELYPVVIREALSYGLPIKMHKLETYGSDYNNNPLITFV